MRWTDNTWRLHLSGRTNNDKNMFGQTSLYLPVRKNLKGFWDKLPAIIRKAYDEWAKEEFNGGKP
jgi:hypothetical protein